MREPETYMPTSIGPFRIERRLGSGGMAETFVGVREGPGGFVQRVCLKRVLPALAEDHELRRLFLREARLGASLRHRNVTQVVELGEDAGAQYLALELVDGMDLRALLRHLPDRRLPLQLAVFVGLEIAAALEHAHGRAVIHRDISPQNILVSLDGEVKLTDFGISKALDDLRMTRSDVVRGNIWYMAPELLERGAVATPRSDLFSLGLVLFECLTGTRPYPTGTQSAATLAVATGAVASLREVAPELPEPVLMLVERLTEFCPEHRFPSARAVVDTLAPLTREAPARRSLGRIVSERREAAAPPAGPIASEPVAQPSPGGSAAAPVARSQRWKKYALAPRVWASATRARLMRSAHSRALPASSANSRSEPAPRGSQPQASQTRDNAPLLTSGGGPVWFAALALACLGVVAVGLTLVLSTLAL